MNRQETGVLSKTKEYTIDAKVANLDHVLALVDEELEAAGCPMKTQMQLDIAVEEIFVNIASYAYKDREGTARITITTEDDPSKAVISFADTGEPFDPLAKPDPDITLSAEERQIGGLGIFMVKKSMDDVTYKYENGENILTISKLL